MIWHFIRYLVTFSIPAFYKRVQARNISALNVKGPVIIAMNHPNAFMDPVCITWVSYPVRVRYMARGDAFKPGLAAFLLGQLGIVPIFRLRDGGREGLQKNDESYKVVNALLKKNAKIIIFAEGLCIQERRLRPLKKGVSRMVFGAYDYLKNDELIIVPVGVNYNAPSKFRSDLFYNVGEPIKVKDLIPAYRENPAKANNQLLQLLSAKMLALVTHIKNKENDVLVVQLEEMVMKEWLDKLHLNNRLENEFTVTKHLTELINNLDEFEPEKVNDLRAKTKDYFLHLKNKNLRDWIINPMNKKCYSKAHLFLKYILLAIMWPVAAVGYIAAYLPYKLTIKTTKKLVKGNKEFYASLILGTGTFIFIFNFLLWFFLIYIFSPTIIEPALATIGMMICSWYAMRYHFWLLKAKGLARALNSPGLYDSLSQKRAEIMQVINGLTNF